MSIAFPISIPSNRGPSNIAIRARSSVGVSASPFTFSQQVYVNQGEMWQAQVDLPPMVRNDAASWISFLVKLNGAEGSFRMGPPETQPRGTWAGVPRLAGQHAARTKTLSVDGFTPGATGKEMDWIQFSSGSGARLHQVVQDFEANGAGVATIEIWPGLRESLPDQQAVITDNPQGTWRLDSNVRQWNVGLAMLYGLSFSCVEVV
jgi:hypothetical protein